MRERRCTTQQLPINDVFTSKVIIFQVSADTSQLSLFKYLEFSMEKKAAPMFSVIRESIAVIKASIKTESFYGIQEKLLAARVFFACPFIKEVVL